MGDFVGHDSGQFILALGEQQQTGIDANEVLRQGKGVDAGIADHEEGERHPVLVGVSHDGLADGVEIFIQLHIVHHRAAPAQPLHDFQPHLLFLVRAEVNLGGIADVRQANGLRGGLDGGGHADEQAQAQGKQTTGHGIFSREKDADKTLEHAARSKTTTGISSAAPPRFASGHARWTRSGWTGPAYGTAGW